MYEVTQEDDDDSQLSDHSDDMIVKEQDIGNLVDKSWPLIETKKL